MTSNEVIERSRIESPDTSKVMEILSPKYKGPGVSYLLLENILVFNLPKFECGDVSTNQKKTQELNQQKHTTTRHGPTFKTNLILRSTFYILLKTPWSQIDLRELSHNQYKRPIPQKIHKNCIQFDPPQKNRVSFNDARSYQFFFQGILNID